MVNGSTATRLAAVALLALAVAVATAHASFAPLDAAPIVGIDFGARYARVAVMTNSTTRQVDIIPNDQGETATPTFVTWNPVTGDAIVGEDAKAQAVLNPSNTVFDFKRLLGRTFNSTEVWLAAGQVPYSIQERDNKPVVSVEVQGELREFSPEEITAMVLAKLKQFAEQYLGQDVHDAVVTVPAYFDDAQREAMREAGKIAGLSFQRIINEPTAAVVATGIDRRYTGEQNVLVINWGGGGLDVTVLEADGGVIEVLATQSLKVGARAERPAYVIDDLERVYYHKFRFNDAFVHLGIDDVSERLVRHCLSQWKKDQHIDLSANNAALQSLRLQAERAMHKLSTETEYIIVVELGQNCGVLSATISQSTLEVLTQELMTSLLETVDKAVADANVSYADVDEIVLVGGASRLPMVPKMLAKRFGEKKPFEGVDKDNAIVHGAAVQGGILSGKFDDPGVIFCHWPLVQVTLGVETAGGLMHPLVRRNTLYPTTKQALFTALHANQTELTIRIFEGERLLTRDNRFLGQLKFSSLGSGPYVEIQFHVDYEYEILSVSARDVMTGVTESLPIQLNERYLAIGSIFFEHSYAREEKAEEAQKHDSKIKADIERCLDTERENEGRESWDLRRTLATTMDAFVPVATIPTHEKR